MFLNMSYRYIVKNVMTQLKFNSTVCLWDFVRMLSESIVYRLEIDFNGFLFLLKCNHQLSTLIVNLKQGQYG